MSGTRTSSKQKSRSLPNERGTEHMRVEEWDLPTIGLRNLSFGDRKTFWKAYQAARPDVRYAWGNTFSRWRVVPGTVFNLSLYITNHSVGLFVRGERGVPLSATRIALAPRKKELEGALDARVDDEAPLLRSLAIATRDPATWARAQEWLARSETDYLAKLAHYGEA